ETIAQLRGMDFQEIAEITTNNFYNCFNIKRQG
ncbi:TPA: TatD family deoxyribonuclease, partial [Legionella pneumophila subsp. pneumophila]|nr:TatD family deoxyribonuclease [Legionella pneumophila subsp. pneumophila]